MGGGGERGVGCLWLDIGIGMDGYPAFFLELERNICLSI